MANRPFSFSKQERLCSETQINELFLSGASFMSYPIRVVWKMTQTEEAPGIQVLMSVPKKKLRHAVDRNRVKRLLRESYRLNKQALLQKTQNQGLSLRIAFVWIPSEVLEFTRVEKKMKEALAKLVDQIE